MLTDLLLGTRLLRLGDLLLERVAEALQELHGFGFLQVSYNGDGDGVKAFRIHADPRIDRTA